MARFSFGHERAQNLAELFSYEFIGSVIRETEKWCAENGYDVEIKFHSLEGSWTFRAWDADGDEYTGTHDDIKGAIYDAFIGLQEE